jgi:menaquinone-dependent protoporphyrinogen IX oxidase
MSTNARPQVLFVYYSYTGQALKIVETMSEVLRDRGCDVTQAAIEFTDQRWAERFTRFPLRHALVDLLGLLLPQLRRATGEISIPKEAQEGEYDLICIGSPTWFFETCMPIRSYLESEAAGKVLEGKPFAGFVVCRRYWRRNLHAVEKLGTKSGGKWLDGIHFTYLGGQVRSLASLISYLGRGENRERYMGLKIPPTNLQPVHLEEARTFANSLADRVSAPPAT